MFIAENKILLLLIISTILFGVNYTVASEGRDDEKI